MMSFWLLPLLEKVMKSDLVLVRAMHFAEARAWCEVHHAAVREVAAGDYPSSVIDMWAPTPITEKAIAQVQENPDQEYRLVAETEGCVVGIGAVIFDLAELRACYVTPKMMRRGIGSILVRKLEDAARARGLTFLQVESSITAEPMYLREGYEVIEHGEHILHTGQRMICVKMRKNLSNVM